MCVCRAVGSKGGEGRGVRVIFPFMIFGSNTPQVDISLDSSSEWKLSYEYGIITVFLNK